MSIVLKIKHEPEEMALQFWGDLEKRLLGVLLQVCRLKKRLLGVIAPLFPIQWQQRVLSPDHILTLHSFSSALIFD